MSTPFSWQVTPTHVQAPLWTLPGEATLTRRGKALIYERTGDTLKEHKLKVYECRKKKAHGGELSDEYK